MFVRQLIVRPLAIAILLAAATLTAHADDLRNVKHGEPLPSYKLPAIDGSVVESESRIGSVTVIVCLSAEQRRSELAALESLQVVNDLGTEPVKLVHVTADVVQKAYFDKFRQERSITAPLAFDADRILYGKLGLIAFPTTIIVNKDGRLDSVISLHGSDYKSLLDAHVRHALGKLTDKELDERLAPRASQDASPRSAASAHRSLARLLKDKGDREGAAKELHKGLEIDPTNNEIILELADLDIAAGNFDSADAMLQKILQTQPDHRRAKQLQGICLFRRGKLDEAQAILQDSLLLNPSPEVGHYYLGRILEQKGDKDRALEHYREALKRLLHETDPAATTSSSPKATK